MSSSPASRSTAVVYDFMAIQGGAEAVALHWLTTHPDWSLVTGFVNESAFPPGSIPGKSLTALGNPVSHPARQAIQVSRDFRQQGDRLTEWDRVLFSGVYAPIGVLARPPEENFYYCHTPPRFAYDLEDWYRERAPRWQRPALAWLAARVRRNFEDALPRMQRIAANSENVRKRLRHYLGIEDVTVIPPPVDTTLWHWLGQDDYYLSTARLEPYKRVDQAVRAFRDLPERKLVVASGGSQRAELEALARGCDNIRFTGWLSQESLRALVGRCIATVYLARDEDFGLSPVESMAAGKPVIAMAEGGLKETVRHNETGVLLNPDDGAHPEALAQAILNLDSERARSMRHACESRAEAFSTERFDRRMTAWLSGAEPAQVDGDESVLR